MTPEKRRLILGFGSLCVTNFACALDATSIGVPLPAIASNLGGSTVEALWAGSSFLLAATVCQPIYTSLSQIFGRKAPLLVALTFFMMGSIVCAVAPNFPTLLCGRTLQGVGVGGIMTLSYVIVTDLVPLSERGNWWGAVTMAVAVGTVAGPLIGGSLAKPKLWRYLFWINVPVCAAAYAAILFCLRLETVKGDVRRKILRVDWIGAALFIASLTAILVPLSWGGSMFAWGQWEIIFPLVVGVFGLGIFMFWSAQAHKEAILPKTMFQDPTALASHLGAAVVGMILWSSIFYMPLYFQAVKGYPPLAAGAAQLPYSVTYGPLSAFIGYKISQKGVYSWALRLGWITLVTGVAHILIFDRGTAISSWILIEALVGIGLGIVSPGIIFAVQASALPADVPHAAGVFVFFRSFGQMMGMVIAGTVFQNALVSKMSSSPLLEADALVYSKDALSMVQFIKHMAASEPRQEIVEAFLYAIRMVWCTVIAFVVVAAIVAFLFAKDYPLSKIIGVDLDKVSATAPSLSDIRPVSPIPVDLFEPPSDCEKAVFRVPPRLIIPQGKEFDSETSSSKGSSLLPSLVERLPSLGSYRYVRGMHLAKSLKARLAASVRRWVHARRAIQRGGGWETNC